MKFDLSQFEELDRTELLEITGGYYGTSGTHIPDSYVYANAQNYTPTASSSYGYTSGSTGGSTTGCNTNPGQSVQPTEYDPKTGWIDPITGKGTVAPPVPGNYEIITYSNGNGAFEYNPNEPNPATATKKISSETNAKYRFSSQRHYKIIVLGDTDGVGGAGHTGIIMETPEGFSSLTGDISTGLQPNKIGVIIKVTRLSDLQARMNSIETIARLTNAEGDPSGGTRYEQALSFTISGDEAANAYSALLGNVDNGYMIPGNQCNDLVQNSLRLSGSSYSGNMNALLPNDYTNWLSSQNNVQTLNLTTSYNF